MTRERLLTLAIGGTRWSVRSPSYGRRNTSLIVRSGLPNSPDLDRMADGGSARTTIVVRRSAQNFVWAPHSTPDTTLQSFAKNPRRRLAMSWRGPLRQRQNAPNVPRTCTTRPRPAPSSEASPKRRVQIARNFEGMFLYPRNVPTQNFSSIGAPHRRPFQLEVLLVTSKPS